VILVDANLLLYAIGESLPEHERARSWLDDKLNGSAPVGLPWPSLLAFVRLASNVRIFERPRPVGDAWRQAKAWLECEPSWIPLPTERHREIIGALLGTGATSSRLVPDAHLAALAIEHGLTLCSTDGDFARFSGLRWENPLG
jgi:uncharacterized protein